MSKEYPFIVEYSDSWPDELRDLEPGEPIAPQTLRVPTESGLTPEEQTVMDALVAAWDALMRLPDVVDGDEQAVFRESIHAMQRVLAARVVARAYPDYWTGAKRKVW